MPGVVAYDLTAFERYVETVRSKATAKRYVIAVTIFLRWMEGTYGAGPLDRLAPEALSDYAVHLLDQEYLPDTVRSHLAGVRRYLRWSQEKCQVKLPEFYRAELPRRKQKVRDVLSREMLSHYFRAAESLHEPFKTAVKLLPCSGLRSQELVSLPLARVQRSNVQLKDGSSKSMLCFSVVGKGGNERITPVFDEGAEVLMEYLRTWRSLHSDELYLFPGRHGHVATRSLREAVQKVRSAFPSETWTPHTMRRTYLTTLYRRGVPLPTLAKIGGHTVQVLIDYYLVLDEHDVVNAVETTGRRLTGEARG